MYVCMYVYVCIYMYICIYIYIYILTEAQIPQTLNPIDLHWLLKPARGFRVPVTGLSGPRLRLTYSIGFRV